MAVTSPDNLWSPDSTDPYNLVPDLAAMQDTTQDALTALRAATGYQVMTNAQRLALTGGSLFEGLRVWTSDTKIEWLYTSSAWYDTRRGKVLKFAQVNPGTILTTTVTTVSGLSLTGCPTGVPVIVEIQVTANNAASGGNRFIDVQAFNGATGIETLQRFALPLMSATAGVYTVNYSVTATPSNDTWTLKLGVDQNSSVELRKATLSLMLAP